MDVSLKIAVSLTVLLTASAAYSQSYEGGASPYDTYGSQAAPPQSEKKIRSLRSYRDIKKFKRPLESQDKFQSVPSSLKPERSQPTPAELKDPRFNYQKNSQLQPSAPVAGERYIVTQTTLASTFPYSANKEDKMRKAVTTQNAPVYRTRPGSQASASPMAPAALAPKQASDYAYVPDDQEFIPEGSRRRATRPAFRSSLFAGYRVDELDWNLAGDFNGSSPETISELEWSDLQIAEVKATAEYTHQSGTLENIHLAGVASYGEILSGENRDSDFFDDEENTEFSRSESDADDGDTMNFKGAIGYTFDYGSADGRRNYSWITPMIGYAYQSLDVNITDGVQIIPATGPLQGLDSNYEAEWNGPYLAVKGGNEYGKHRFELLGEFHYGDYEAEAEWNLRADLNQPLSSVDKADMIGFVAGGSYSYLLTDALSLSAEAQFQSFTIDDGQSTFLVVDPQQPGTVTAITQKLNEADLQSQAYRVGLSYVF